MLYRRWSLYESMFHTNYVATRMGIWRDRGQERLRLLFARLGIPQREMEERFGMMNETLRARFMTHIEREAAEAGLTDLFYGSFHKAWCRPAAPAGGLTGAGGCRCASLTRRCRLPMRSTASPPCSSSAAAASLAAAAAARTTARRGAATLSPRSRRSSALLRP
jgi:hypothetical protein